MLTQLQIQKIALISLSFPEYYYVMKESGELAFYCEDSPIFYQEKLSVFDFYDKIHNYLSTLNQDLEMDWSISHEYRVNFALQEYELLTKPQPRQASNF